MVRGVWGLSASAGYRITGALGTAIVSVAGLAAGALPVPEGIWLGDWHAQAAYALPAVYFGLTLLVAAWWWAGRDHSDTRGRMVTLAIWSCPLLVAPPLFSRDVYSYAAQGAMAQAGLDVYRFGVTRLGGPLAAQVAPAWQSTTTPYGPVSLLVSKSVMGVAGSNVVWSVLGLRLVSLSGLALLVLALPRLAEYCGADPSEALWLGALNPLVPLHLVAGAHNDALMVGLLVAGLTVALGRWYAVATVLITLAALVKIPAAAGLIVVAVLWRSPWRLALTAAITTLAATAIAGTGFGWITALGTPADKHSWSLTSALGRLFGGTSMRWFLVLGMVAAIALALWAWRRRERLGAVYALGLGLAALAFLGPATRPWYALWGLVPIAAAAPAGKARQIAALTAGALALLVLPSGFGPDGEQLALAAAGVALGFAAFVLPRPWVRFA